MRAGMASVALTASPAARRSDSCTAFQEVQTGAVLAGSLKCRSELHCQMEQSVLCDRTAKLTALTVTTNLHVLIEELLLTARILATLN